MNQCMRLVTTPENFVFDNFSMPKFMESFAVDVYLLDSPVQINIITLKLNYLFDSNNITRRLGEQEVGYCRMRWSNGAPISHLYLHFLLQDGWSASQVNRWLDRTQGSERNGVRQQIEISSSPFNFSIGLQSFSVVLPCQSLSVNNTDLDRYMWHSRSSI